MNLSKTSVLKIAVAWIFSAVFSHLHAEAPSITDSAEYVRCISADYRGIGPNAHRIECIQTELNRYQSMLDYEYKSALKLRHGASRRKLIRSQRAWMAFRKARCEYEFTLDMPPNPYANQQMCLVGLTIEQWYRMETLHDIKSWQ
jgi:uncharacterized protein YecT (DUF1311 family)